MVRRSPEEKVFANCIALGIDLHKQPLFLWVQYRKIVPGSLVVLRTRFVQ